MDTALSALSFIMLFINAIQAARKWNRGEAGWAGAYAASFTFCAMYMSRHWA